METYDYHIRSNHQSWLLMHIETLISEAIKHNNSSLVLYACLESRNLLEKIEFEVILMSTKESEWPDLILKMKGKSGIQGANKELKTLKYRLQTFSESISKISDLPVKAYDYKKSEILQKELAEYIHIYTRRDEDLMFGSDFINSGIDTAYETIKFVKSYFIKQGHSFIFGVLNFETLKEGKFQKEFENWKKSIDTDTEALFQRLKKINDEFYDGAKAIPLNDV